MLDKIVHLQTPETETKTKGERLNRVECERKPKRLRFNDVCEDIHNANNVAERLRKMSIRFSLFVHTYNVLPLSRG